MNPLNKMSECEWRTILERLKVSADGPFFSEDIEFQIIFGIERHELQSVIDEWWVDDDTPSEDVTLAINNSLNNLLGYPHGKNHLWSEYISVSPREVERVFEKWREKQLPLYIHEQ